MESVEDFRMGDIYVQHEKQMYILLDHENGIEFVDYASFLHGDFIRGKLMIIICC